MGNFKFRIGDRVVLRNGANAEVTNRDDSFGTNRYAIKGDRRNAYDESELRPYIPEEKKKGFFRRK